MSFHLRAGLVVLALGVGKAQAQTAANPQSPLRPLGLQLWSSTQGKVMRVGSDPTSLSFKNNTMPGFISLINSNLREQAVFQAASDSTLSPDKLFFFFDYAPRLYFLTEGAAYTNALGAAITDAKPSDGTSPLSSAFLVFPNSQSPVGGWNNGSGVRSTSEPLMPGDFVQFPTIHRGEQLELFLMGNLNSSGVPEGTYFNETSLNVDHLIHMVAFFPPNSNFVIIGFEDIKGGGDLDYNDLVFALDVGANNAQVWRDPNGSLPR